MNEKREDLIEGRNAVIEALRAGHAIDKIYIARGESDKALGYIASQARAAGIAVADCDRRKLDAMSVTKSHQGVIAACAVREYCSLDDILDIAQARGEPPFVIVCDEISDPHNLGAIIRSAECAGAVAHMAVARVVNLPSALGELKEKGLWVYGAAAGAASTLWQTDFSGPACLVIGSEGQGLGRLVAEKCDFLVGIPMRGKISSLNASAAAVVMMYEIMRQRQK